MPSCAPTRATYATSSGLEDDRSNLLRTVDCCGRAAWRFAVMAGNASRTTHGWHYDRSLPNYQTTKSSDYQSSEARLALRSATRLAVDPASTLAATFAHAPAPWRIGRWRPLFCRLATGLDVVPTQMRAAAKMYEFWRKEKQVRAGRGRPSPFWVRTVTQIKAQHKFFRMCGCMSRCIMYSV